MTSFRALTAHRLFWPLALLVLLLLIAAVNDPGFFAVRIQGGHLYGSLIDIIRLSAPLGLVAIGMTLVIALRGIDLSVGAVVAIGGAVACTQIAGLVDQGSVGGVLSAVGLALGLSLVAGLWNGVLVAAVGIQPIIATLVLMVAGRGIAQMITDGQIVTVSSDPYHLIGGGYVLGLPFSSIVAGLSIGLVALLVRRSALGVLIESVGGNPEASRLAGIKSRGMIIGAYAFCGLCAGAAGLMISSNISGADGNNAGLWIELDAIFAVVIGGTSLVGGRFYLGGTVVGVLVIQTMTQVVLSLGLPSETTLVVKAVVVTAVCLLQSPAYRAAVRARFLRRREVVAAANGGPATTAEVPDPSASSAASATPAEVQKS
ncbi:ABC transporter permease [Streptomyces sp. NBC_01013]|uniref:ABC transporter permease n=1 Tax=Streptomyces sp. NBC_01013 TaxID=2903718 RepID=UPI00386F9EE8|nr:ABC transporter permease [Streptomyces sp. NBC_01013]